ncbi:hypothetical protein CoNPh11_CDS0065 [Staphylococcus phage S-CoN_Ph11]|nr:hypothetical protein CoNPh11_CDS0065 [Staphylococcus phage S-CoN_Ph11]
MFKIIPTIFLYSIPKFTFIFSIRIICYTIISPSYRFIICYTNIFLPLILLTCSYNI